MASTFSAGPAGFCDPLRFEWDELERYRADSAVLASLWLEATRRFEYLLGMNDHEVWGDSRARRRTRPVPPCRAKRCRCQRFRQYSPLRRRGWCGPLSDPVRALLETRRSSSGIAPYWPPSDRFFFSSSWAVSSSNVSPRPSRFAASHCWKELWLSPDFRPASRPSTLMSSSRSGQ